MAVMCDVLQVKTRSIRGTVRYSSSPLPSPSSLLLKACSWDQRQGPHRGAGQKCSICTWKGESRAHESWRSCPARENLPQQVRTCYSRFLAGRMILAETFCRVVVADILRGFGEKRMPVLTACLQNKAKIVMAEPWCRFNCCVTLSRLLNSFASHFPQFPIKVEL